MFSGTIGDNRAGGGGLCGDVDDLRVSSTNLYGFPALFSYYMLGFFVRR